MEILEKYLYDKKITFGKQTNIDHLRYERNGTFDDLGDLMTEFAEIYHQDKLKSMVSSSDVMNSNYKYSEDEC